MSWQERIEKYKQEQVRLKTEAEMKCQEEQELRYRSLLETADSLDLKGLLGEICDQVWKLGEISLLASKDSSKEIRDEIPLYYSFGEEPLVAFILRAEWPCYRGGYYKTVPRGEYTTEEEWVNSPHEEIHSEELCILCKGNKEKTYVSLRFNRSFESFASFNFTSAEKTRQEIEEALVKYYAQPWVNKPPYNEKAREDLEILEEWKKKNHLFSKRSSSFWKK